MKESELLERAYNDRTTRVMQTTSFSLGEMLFAKTVEKRKMRIGDSCVFQCEPDSRNKNKIKKHRVMVGHVMSFRTLSAASKKR